MCRWRAWWKGLPPLALLIAAAVFFSRAPVESDLSERAENLMNEIGESWARASFDGRDALLQGEALSEDARLKVRAELARMSGVRTVEDRTTLLPERRPFTLSAIRDGSNLRLEGYVPSRYARVRIVEAARTMLPGVTVSGAEGLVRARGVPAGDFAGVVAFGIAQLAKMPSGRVTISDDAFSIEGRAPDFATYDALEVTVRTELPPDFKLARFAVLPPAVSPFLWSAQRDEDGVQLSGYIPLGDARRSLLDAVRGAVPGAAISDQLRLADGAPPTDGWLKAAAFALQQLGRLPGGKVTLSDTTIALEGRAPDFAAYDALAAARRAVPEGYTVTRFAVEPPTVAPFTWGVLRGANGLRVVGYAPSEDAKRLVGDAVRAAFPGVPVSDEMRIASGGPSAETWVAATVFGVNQLAKLRTGEVRAYRRQAFHHRRGAGFRRLWRGEHGTRRAAARRLRAGKIRCAPARGEALCVRAAQGRAGAHRLRLLSRCARTMKRCLAPRARATARRGGERCLGGGARRAGRLRPRCVRSRCANWRGWRAAKRGWTTRSCASPVPRSIRQRLDAIRAALAGATCPQVSPPR